MKKSTLLIGTLLAIFCTLSTAEKKPYYKWKDSEGNVQYGERPPKGVKYEIIKIHSGKKNSRASAKPAATQTDTSQQAEDNSLHNELRKAKERIDEGCRVAKINMETLKTASRIGVDDGQGGRRLITAEEKAKKMEETQKQIDRYCIKKG
ncbi:DUF4124 domain-containing protein [Pleionea sp. CnH1-48]|uniref:DUF4124 domain-containing protein n=1 Tax=Pleionea sp. CnH1-48 TaxID=2954494 RepID=UPI0020970F2E|nr:DUF4124 domain-containing protein [Pleionea sp. CnH1-48]MCO7225300.1 DUF4124 domain-containing protein [Pleionea sp. CnH1-48]